MVSGSEFKVLGFELLFVKPTLNPKPETQN